MRSWIAVTVLAGILVPALTTAMSRELRVPFTPQAPEARWVEPWANACEETALVMVNAYYEDETLSGSRGKTRISEALKKKNTAFGESKDESAALMADIVAEVYDWEAFVVTEATLPDIKEEIDGGRPVIIPFDARRVKNRFFQSPRPDYHVAVIIGYDNDKQQFIVHDPGTAKGKAFRYSYDELLGANETYTIGDTGEERGGEVIFTAPGEARDSALRRVWQRLAGRFSGWWAGVWAAKP